MMDRDDCAVIAKVEALHDDHRQDMKLMATEITRLRAFVETVKRVMSSADSDLAEIDKAIRDL